MNIFKIACNYELDQRLNKLLGQNLILIAGKSVLFGMPNRMSVEGNLQLRSCQMEADLQIYHLNTFVSKRAESYAGNLHGIVLVETHSGTLGDVSAQSDYPGYVLHEFGKIVKIVGIGIKEKEQVIVQDKVDDIIHFFPKGTMLPDQIDIDVKTLQVIGIQVESGLWQYIYSDWESAFRLELESRTTPDDLCKHPDFFSNGTKYEDFSNFSIRLNSMIESNDSVLI